MPSTDVPASAPVRAEASSPTGRLHSLDVLRGFDMAWILGLDAIFLALGRLFDAAPFPFLARQVEHVAWEGFAFYDLIFPLFVFITGVSLVFALPKTVERFGRTGAMRRVLLRTALLFLLGVLYNGGLAAPWPDVRLAGVLQRIALAYAGAAVLFVYARAWVRHAAAVGLLVGYWALLTFIPVRDITLTKEAMAAHFGGARPPLAQVEQLYAATTTTVPGGTERGRNLANHLDFVALPGGKYEVYWDPEGWLSTLPAIATCLLGVLAGTWLRRADLGSREKLRRLLLAGGASLALGWLWHLQFPVVKQLWTSSFVLVAGGWSFLLLAACFYAVDVRGWRGAWCQPFVWIGLNPITLYLATSLVSFWGIAERLVGGSVAAWLDANFAPGTGALVLALTTFGLLLGLARFLYTRQIFLRV